ncbi:MAG: hypothetical protein ACFBSE_04475 [Prochloraceae cyanobacterium]
MLRAGRSDMLDSASDRTAWMQQFRKPLASFSSIGGRAIYFVG